MKTRKALINFFVAVILIATIGSTAYASEINMDASVLLDETNTNENTDDINLLNEEQATSADELLDEQGQVTDSEVYFDEQGEPYYLEPTNEDVTEEQQDKTTVIEDKQDVKEEVKDVVKKEAKKEVKKAVKKVKEVVVEEPSYSEADLRLLSCLIYSEAGNQSYNGMLAVANVVLNRAKSDVYWHVNTIKEVIYDRKWNSVQFSVTIKCKSTGISPLDKALKSYDTGKYSGGNPGAEITAMNKCIKAAKAALEGENNIENYLCFTALGYNTNSIKNNYSSYKIIGNHIFYRTK